MEAIPFPTEGSGPPACYIPGIDGTGELLFDTAQKLRTRFALQRFRYEGDGPRDKALYGQLAGSVAAALPARPSLLIAESFGGGVALRLALDYPERVSGLMLVNTFARYPNRHRIAAGAKLLPVVPKFVLSLGRRWMPGRLFFRPRRDAAAEAQFRQMKPGFFSPGYAARLAAIRELDLLPELLRIQVPCALYAATHDRVVASPRTMREMVERLPNATLEPIERAGHVVLPLTEEPWLERLVALHARAQPCGDNPTRV